MKKIPIDFIIGAPYHPSGDWRSIVFWKYLCLSENIPIPPEWNKYHPNRKDIAYHIDRVALFKTVIHDDQVKGIFVCSLILKFSQN